MPISAEYSWEERRDHFVVHVPLRGVAASKVDVLATSGTLKVNFAPYLVDVILRGEIDPLRHKATVKDGELRVKLFKKNPGDMWGSFAVDAEEDADVVKKARADAVAAHESLVQALDEKRRDRRVEDERYSTRQQMKLDELERGRLEDLKAEEKQREEEAMYASFAQMEREKEKEIKQTATTTVPRAQDSYKQPLDTIDDDYEGEVLMEDDFDADEAAMDHLTSSLGRAVRTANQSRAPIEAPAVVEKEKEMKFIPPPRSLQDNLSSAVDGSGGRSVPAKVGIEFTPRIFPTPMRESKAAEEEDWIAKNRKHLKKHSMFNKNLKGDITEQDPSWLKAKGDDFYRGGDVRSAINAYSSAIEADEDMIACYSNRSACYLRLGMDQDCKEDCTVAMQKLEKQRGPDSELASADTAMMVKLLLRRGVAQCRLGQMVAALADYVASCAILVGHGGEQIQVAGVSLDTVQDDIKRLKRIVAADEKKTEADLAFSNSDPSKAQALYSEAIEYLPEHVACLSNRSACKIALGDLTGCIEDCTKAIDLLQAGVQHSANEQLSDSMLSMLHAIIPPAGSEKRKQWLLKSLVRRGAIYAQLNDLVSAARDYSLAVSLDPENKDLQADLQNIINARVKREQTSVNK